MSKVDTDKFIALLIETHSELSDFIKDHDLTWGMNV